jgi:hypothetical protein
MSEPYVPYQGRYQEAAEPQAGKLFMDKRAIT